MFARSNSRRAWPQTSRALAPLNVSLTAPGDPSLGKDAAPAIVTTGMMNSWYVLKV